MRRQILSAIATAAVAPYLGATSLTISMALKNPKVPLPEDIAAFCNVVIFLGTVGLFIYGIPILGIAVITAITLEALDVRSFRAITATASIIGLCFGILLEFPSFYDWPFILGLFISGAICGWIYWRIAMKPNRSRRSIYPA